MGIARFVVRRVPKKTEDDALVISFLGSSSLLPFYLVFLSLYLVAQVLNLILESMV